MCQMVISAKRNINERKGLDRNMEDVRIRTCSLGKLLEEVTFDQSPE